MEQKKQSVLLVEDDPALRKLVNGYLGLMGFAVTEAPDGKSAIQRLTEAAFDLVCLDLMLPESSGYDVCEFIRQSDKVKHVPILMMSARTLPEDRAHAEEVGASAYLIKPFSRQQFSKQVREVLTKAQPRA